jgi:RNA polymerase sigma-70 factor (ECF subfamily)
MRFAPANQPDAADLDDRELVLLAKQGQPGAFRAIMTRNNRRLYRVARSIVRDEHEAEDVLQESYVRAFGAIGAFRNDAALSTWLTRIVLNEALGRVRSRRQTTGASDAAFERDGAAVVPFPYRSGRPDPERAAARREIAALLERLVDEVPEPFRVVFMMRAVEEISIEETARALDLRPETVKTRLHRARRLLRDRLEGELGATLLGIFPFEAPRCTRVAGRVLDRLRPER